MRNSVTHTVFRRSGFVRKLCACVMFTFFQAMLSLHNGVSDETWSKLKPVVMCRLLTVSPKWNLGEDCVGILVESVAGTNGERVVIMRVAERLCHSPSR